MIAYKGTENFKCINITYEVGKTYTLQGEIKTCKQGFHFCKELKTVDRYYSFYRDDTVVLKIKVLGDVIEDGDKCVTNKFKVLSIVNISKYKLKYNKFGNVTYLPNINGSYLKTTYDKKK